MKTVTGFDTESKRLKVYRSRAHRRQWGRCFWCLDAVHIEDATADHLVEKKDGGLTIRTNIVMACKRCNNLRSNSGSIEQFMKEVTESRLTHVLAAHPNATVQVKDGVKTVSIPLYDIETDKAWTETLKVTADPVETPVGIVPVFNVRTGPQFSPDGDAKVSPLGKLYKIIGYTPPPKDDDAS